MYLFFSILINLDKKKLKIEKQIIKDNKGEQLNRYIILTDRLINLQIDRQTDRCVERQPDRQKKDSNWHPVKCG